MSDIGHNSGISGPDLKAYVARIETAEAEKDALTADIRDIYKEAKSAGFDAKIMRKLVALRKKDAAERAEEEALLASYMSALGMLSDLPLGQAALEREFGAAA